MTEQTFWTVERFILSGDGEVLMFGRWKELYVHIETEALAFELFDKAKAEYDRPLRLVKTVRYVVETAETGGDK